MPIHLEGTAPYAPASVVIDFLTRHRNGGIPTPVTQSTLDRLGVSESLQPRTLQALKLLDFIDDKGDLTAEFAMLRKVPTPEYPLKLSEMLQATYADVFAIVNPSGATHEQVSDAFRGFKPAGQTSRMVTLFLLLLEYTGAWPDLPSSRGSVAPVKKSPRKQVEKTTRIVPLVPPPAREEQQSTDDMRRAYFDLLLEKAKSENGADAELLNRIERVLGLADVSQPLPPATGDDERGRAS